MMELKIVKERQNRRRAEGKGKRVAGYLAGGRSSLNLHILWQFGTGYRIQAGSSRYLSRGLSIPIRG